MSIHRASDFHPDRDQYLSIARRPWLDRDPRQRELSEKYIDPHPPEIFCAYQKVRNFIDDVIARKKGASRYPIGYCHEITSLVFGKIDIHIRKDFPDFFKNGGIHKRVYGIQFEKYFHWCIQLGSWIFDVANDTVDATKPKVVYGDRGVIGPVPITSYAQWKAIAVPYREVRIIPNPIPLVRVVYPALTVQRDEDGGRFYTWADTEALYVLDAMNN